MFNNNNTIEALQRYVGPFMFLLLLSSMVCPLSFCILHLFLCSYMLFQFSSFHSTVLLCCRFKLVSNYCIVNIDVK